MASKHYQAGRDFTVTLTVPDLAPTDYLVAELTGPIGDDGEPQTSLKTRADRSSKPRDHKQDEYILRGPVPETAVPGNYRLTGVAVHYGGPGPQRVPREYGKEALPELSIVIDPYGEIEPPPLPRITKAE